MITICDYCETEPAVDCISGIFYHCDNPVCEAEATEEAIDEELQETR